MVLTIIFLSRSLFGCPTRHVEGYLEQETLLWFDWNGAQRLGQRRLYHGYDTFRYGRVRSFHAFVLKAISQDTTKVYMVES